MVPPNEQEPPHPTSVSLSDAIHSLQNALTTIRGLPEFVALCPECAKPGTETIQKIIQSADEARNILEQLSKYSKDVEAEAKKIAGDLAAFELGAYALERIGKELGNEDIILETMNGLQALRSLRLGVEAIQRLIRVPSI